MNHLPSTVFLTPLLTMLLASAPAAAQYTPSAGTNAPAEAYEAERTADGDYARDASGKVRYKKTRAAPQKDGHGNAQGNQYDLAYDGAFEGQTVLILDQVGNTLDNTKAALAQKGFSTVVYHSTPEVSRLQEDLKKSSQVWLLSSTSRQLSDQHIAAIKAFFDEGHGVYIWGDNDPLYVDANRLADALVPGLGMKGNVYGDTIVHISQKGSVGVREGHLITTGLEHLYEGVTIATVYFDGGQTQEPASNGTLQGKDRRWNQAKLSGPVAKHWKVELPQGFTPLLYGSTGNLVSVAYEKGGKRLVLDGGFTRLAISWDNAGTARFVKNAASWLANAERHPTVSTNASQTKAPSDKVARQ